MRILLLIPLFMMTGCQFSDYMVRPAVAPRIDTIPTPTASSRGPVLALPAAAAWRGYAEVDLSGSKGRRSGPSTSIFPAPVRHHRTVLPALPPKSLKVGFPNESTTFTDRGFLSDLSPNKSRIKTITVTGHSHGRSRIGVKALAKGRADSVAAALIADGIPASKIKTRANYSNGKGRNPFARGAVIDVTFNAGSSSQFPTAAKTTQQFRVAQGEGLNIALTRWAAEANWAVHWDKTSLPKDWILDASATFSGSFQEAATKLVNAARLSSPSQKGFQGGLRFHSSNTPPLVRVTRVESSQ